MPWNPNTAGSTAQQDNQDTPILVQVLNQVPSAARTANGNGNGIYIGNAALEFNVLLDVTAVSGTTPSLVIGVQWSTDGSTWFDADPADVMTAVTAVGRKTKGFNVKGSWARITWTITGTTPSFTFACHTDLDV